MRIAIKRLTNERHELRISRGDGSSEARELETRSLLLHDLVHYAVEAEAPLERAFWGLLSEGTTFDELDDRTRAEPLSPQLGVAERLVGPLQSLVRGRLPRETFSRAVATLSPELSVSGDFVDRVERRLHALRGAWRATPHGGTLHLEWPPTSEPRVESPP